MKSLPLLPEKVYRLWDELDAFKAHDMLAANVHLMETIAGWLQADYAYWVGGVRVADGELADNDLMNGWRARAVERYKFPPTFTEHFEHLMENQELAETVGMSTTAITRQAGSFRIRLLRELVDPSARCKLVDTPTAGGTIRARGRLAECRWVGPSPGGGNLLLGLQALSPRGVSGRISFYFSTFTKGGRSLMSMKVSLVLRAAACVALGGWLFAAKAAQAAPTWGVDLNDVFLQIDADAYADNGVNSLRPTPGAFFEDSASADVSNFQANFNASFFGQPAETFDLGADVNVFGEDEGFNPDFRTSASSVGVIGIKGLGTRTLDIFWRANTANTQRDFLDEFYSDSTADLTAQIVATINGVAPGTPVTISYDWEYLGTAVIDHEAGNEDPTTASGSLSFVDEQGLGPGNLFAVSFAEPGPLGGVDDDNDSHTLTTSTTGDPSFLTVDLDGFSDTIMNWPGDPPPGATQDDQASSVFNGRLTLTLPIPEPSSAALMLLGLLALARFVRRR